jgi:hypothetical protein
MENIAVDQKHDLTARRFGFCDAIDSFDDETLLAEPFEIFFDNNKSWLESFDV